VKKHGVPLQVFLYCIISKESGSLTGTVDPFGITEKDLVKKI